MAYKQYTKCYVHQPGDKPFNKKDLAGLAVLHGLLPAAFFGALTGLAVGLGVGGPIGAAVGIVVGFFAGITVGVANALTEASKQWRYHRLICLGGPECAIGSVRTEPEIADLGEFDNDKYFDLSLMPHRADRQPGDKLYEYRLPSKNYQADRPGIIDPTVQQNFVLYPRNDVYTDPEGCQGSKLMKPNKAFDDELPYDTTRTFLHVEAEGDFWVRMADLAFWLGLLTGLMTAATVIATAAGATAGAAAGDAIGCAIGALFGGLFGVIACLIGAALGAALGALLAGGAVAATSALILKAILQAIFEVDPGDVEDANVGDKPLGKLNKGDKVAVYGEHVYDGFHEGWHELHPLMAIQRIGPDSLYYLEWDPEYPNPAEVLPDLPWMASYPKPITGLTGLDVIRGLNSQKFQDRAIAIHDRWCGLLAEAFHEKTGTSQQGLDQRWTIHPNIDGCLPPKPPDPPR
jgi:hypothetical protein